MRLDDGGHTVRWCARRKEAKIFPVPVHQIDEAGMIDGVLGGAPNRDLGEIHPVGARGVPDSDGIRQKLDYGPRCRILHRGGKIFTPRTPGAKIKI